MIRKVSWLIEDESIKEIDSMFVKDENESLSIKITVSLAKKNQIEEFEGTLRVLNRKYNLVFRMAWINNFCK